MVSHLYTLAASSDPGAKIGDNIFQILQGFATKIYLGLVIVFILAYASGRKIGQLAVFIVVALGIGVIVMDSSGWMNIVKAIGDAVTKNV